MKSSRLVAFEILCDVFIKNAFSNIALDKALQNANGRDKAFISAIVYGVIERRLTLDYLIDNYLSAKPKTKVKIILYIGAYQLYFMKNVPPSAAINTSVELARETGVSYYKKLINAVLHRIDDNRINIDSLDDLSVRFSCPKHLINMWNKMYGAQQTFSILSCINEKPPVFAVANTLFVTADELLYALQNSGISGELDGDLVKITSSFDLRQCKPFQDGLFHIEDKSSFECARALDAAEGETVLDICSAPGGKAFTISEGMNNKGKIYAFDLYEHRLALIRKGAERLGLKNLTAAVNDAEIFNESIPMADKILCDVPCSGFGIIRRKPEIRYKELDSVKGLPSVQLRILETSSKYLKSGGRIVYSTCTLSKKENEKVVQSFLDCNNNFSLIFDKTIIPNNNGGDGFYYAVMEKKYA